MIQVDMVIQVKKIKNTEINEELSKDVPLLKATTKTMDELRTHLKQYFKKNKIEVDINFIVHPHDTNH
jgi:FKBP-type peptidyl-prolyl cis-trans isomerase (trigger factor)